jgi:hypothetical protein
MTVYTGKTPRKSDRRRQPGIHGRGRQKLTAPEIKGFFTAFVNDVDTRLHDKTVLDDYEFVERSEVNDEIGEDGKSNSDLGSKVRVLVDKSETGQPIYAYLLKKKLEYAKADKAEAEKGRLSREDELRRGNDRIENQYGHIK